MMSLCTPPWLPNPAIPSIQDQDQDTTHALGGCRKDMMQRPEKGSAVATSGTGNEPSYTDLPCAPVDIYLAAKGRSGLARTRRRSSSRSLQALASDMKQTGPRNPRHWSESSTTVSLLLMDSCGFVCLSPPICTIANDLQAMISDQATQRLQGSICSERKNSGPDSADSLTSLPLSPVLYRRSQYSSRTGQS